jgi:DNA invertase Pin-like site-specific DNA recombinase
VLDDPTLDTATAHGELLFTVLGAIAAFERKLMVARTGEGRARAKARGLQLGKSNPDQRKRPSARA